jgi:hypothetical protein
MNCCWSTFYPFEPNYMFLCIYWMMSARNLELSLLSPLFLPLPHSSTHQILSVLPPVFQVQQLLTVSSPSHKGFLTHGPLSSLAHSNLFIINLTLPWLSTSTASQYSYSEVQSPWHTLHKALCYLLPPFLSHSHSHITIPYSSLQLQLPQSFNYSYVPTSFPFQRVCICQPSGELSLP